MSALRRRSCLGTALAVFGLCVSLFFLSNIFAGVFFEIPDNLPLVGNLDEAFFTMIFLASLSYLGIEIPFLSNRFNRYGGVESHEKHIEKGADKTRKRGAK